MAIFDTIGNYRIAFLGEEAYFLSYKLEAEEALLASGGCPETSALCGKTDMASKESGKIQCGELLEDYNSISVLSLLWWHLGEVRLKSAGKQHLSPPGR